jgi:hypothetical protein
MPCRHSQSTISGVLCPARLSHTSRTRSGGSCAGKVKRAARPACQTCQAARATPDWCCGSPVGGAPARWRAQTASGPCSCPPARIRAAAGRAAPAVANCCPDTARSGMGRPRPRTRPPDPWTGRAYRPARSAPFYRCITVDDRDRAMLAPARDHPGLAPSAALLPTPARRVQRSPDRVGADTREAVLRLA